MHLEMNSLYYGDCLEVMRKWPDDSFDLVYLDPPFNSQTNYNVLFGKSLNDEGSQKMDSAQLTAFEDTWTWDEKADSRVDAITMAVGHPAHDAIVGLHNFLGNCGMLAYLSYMAERIAEIWRVTKDTGSIYLHCDPTASHYLKIILDGVYGHENYRNEITWKRYAVHSLSTRSYNSIADTILYYGKTGDAQFSPVYAVGDEQSLEKKFPYIEKETGRRFQHVALEQSSNRSSKDEDRIIDGVRVKGTIGWRWTQETFDNRIASNPHLIYWTKSGRPRFKQYADEYKGAPIGNIWTDIPYLSSASSESFGYPTQKPLALLDRIINASSNEGDIVLDPFCGCGTTVVSANSLQRKWVGIDVSPFAISLIRQHRLGNLHIPVNGIPLDIEAARLMARTKPFEFEKWAISCIPGIVPNSKQVGDGGIDGRGKIWTTLDLKGTVLVQIKGGKFSLSSLRDFLHTVQRENAAMGVYVSLDKVNTKAAKEELSRFGKVKFGAKEFPKVQIWSVAEHFEGVEPKLPPMADPYTGQKSVTKQLL